LSRDDREIRGIFTGEARGVAQQGTAGVFGAITKHYATRQE
jgi:hypothetical protein